jgi:hypothetical protein
MLIAVVLLSEYVAIIRYDIKLGKISEKLKDIPIAQNVGVFYFCEASNSSKILLITTVDRSYLIVY